MSKSKVRQKKFPCGHKGFGEYCHRCAQADELEAMVKKGKQKKTTHRVKKKGSKQKTTQESKMTIEQMKEEAERLRKEGKGRT